MSANVVIVRHIVRVGAQAMRMTVQAMRVVLQVVSMAVAGEIMGVTV